MANPTAHPPRPVFALEALHYTYPAGPPTLAGLAARLPAGGLTLLVGPNAGGKTTLLRLLAGLLAPQRGRIVRGETGAALSPTDLRRAARLVMQDAETQILGPRVGDDILLGAAASARPERFADEARRLTSHFRLDWHAPTEALSYGQKKKLALLHALLAEPEILLLDEPFAGLDYPAALELREVIRNSRGAGLTQIVTLHDLEPLFDMADWLVVVENGTVSAEGRPEDLRGDLRRRSVRPPGGGWD